MQKKLADQLVITAWIMCKNDCVIDVEKIDIMIMTVIWVYYITLLFV